MTRHGEARALLIEHAVNLLEEVGVGEFTGREVARRAGVSHGAPRRHFSSRAALLSAVAAQGFTDLRARMRTAQRRPQTTADPVKAREELCALANEYVSFAQEHPAMFELMFRHDLLEDSGEQLRHHSLALFTLASDCVAQIGPAEPAEVTTDLWAGIHGLAVLASRRALEPITTDRPEVLVVRQVNAHTRPRL